MTRFHDGAVNAVAVLPDDRFATAGEDGRIAIFRTGGIGPVQVFTEHRAPVVGLAVSPDGSRLASASWDGTVHDRPLAGGEARVFEGHRGNVNAVAFLPDGRLVSAAYDATVRIWTAPDAAPLIVSLPAPANALSVLSAGEIAAGAADGAVYIVGAQGSLLGRIDASHTPILALAAPPQGSPLAAATVAGEIVRYRFATTASHRQATRKKIGPPNASEQDWQSTRQPLRS